mmetsp:Transcript_3593/g.15797  ORF Transcript_3593/g.15797 Transcript_3593/m.15797 type:complete len:340 (+) Transcript_3593:157-1176(+)
MLVTRRMGRRRLGVGDPALRLHRLRRSLCGRIPEPRRQEAPGSLPRRRGALPRPHGHRLRPVRRGKLRLGHRLVVQLGSHPVRLPLRLVPPRAARRRARTGRMGVCADLSQGRVALRRRLGPRRALRRRPHQRAPHGDNRRGRGVDGAGGVAGHRVRRAIRQPDRRSPDRELGIRDVLREQDSRLGQGVRADGAPVPLPRRPLPEPQRGHPAALRHPDGPGDKAPQENRQAVLRVRVYPRRLHARGRHREGPGHVVQEFQPQRAQPLAGRRGVCRVDRSVRHVAAVVPQTPLRALLLPPPQLHVRRQHVHDIPQPLQGSRLGHSRVCLLLARLWRPLVH